MSRGFQDPRKRGGFLAWSIIFLVATPIVYGLRYVLDKIGIVAAVILGFILYLLCLILYKLCIGIFRKKS